MRRIDFKQFGVRNFLSIGNDPIEINFTSGIHLITGHNLDRDGRRNGVGKSTVMDAFHWVLFGSPIREIKKGTIANFNTKGKCEGWVEFDVTLDGKKSSYKVTRTLSPTKCELWIDGEDKTLSTVPQTSELIEKILGFTSILFRNSAIISINKTQPFLDQDKTTKRKFIEGVFNLEVFSNILADVRKRAVDTKAQIDISFTKLDGKNQNIKVYKAQSETFESEKKKKLESFDKERVNLDTKKREIEVKVVDSTELETKRAALKSKREQIGKAIETNTDSVNFLKEAIMGGKLRIEKIEREKADYEKTLASKTTIEETIQKLAIPENIEELTAKINVLKESKAAAKAKIAKVHEAKSAAEQAIWKDEQNIQAIVKEKTDYINSTKQSICPTCKRPLEQKIVLEESKVAEFDARITKAKENVAALRTTLEEKTSKMLRELEEGVNCVDTSIVELTKRVGTAEKLIAERRAYDNQMKSILEVIEKVDPSKFQVSIDVLVNENIQRNEKVEAHTNVINKLRTEGLSKIDAEIEKLNAKFTENERVKTELKSVMSQIETLERNRGGAQNEKNPFIDMIATSEKEHEIIEKEWNDLRSLHSVLESAKFVVSEEGVKSFIIKKLLNALNERIDYYLKKLDAPCTCVFNEFFDETIKNDRGVECSYNNFSGAEMKSIDLACLFAFMDIRRMQGDVSINISMFDEIFDSSFDERGMDFIIEVLRERVVKNDEAIFVISHRKESKKAVTGEVIYLEKRNGVTKRLMNVNEIPST